MVQRKHRQLDLTGSPDFNDFDIYFKQKHGLSLSKNFITRRSHLIHRSPEGMVMPLALSVLLFGLSDPTGEEGTVNCLNGVQQILLDSHQHPAWLQTQDLPCSSWCH